ncbi:hypothetical protein GCM10025777_17340 [Membranihabitans marinus]
MKISNVFIGHNINKMRNTISPMMTDKIIPAKKRRSNDIHCLDNSFKSNKVEIIKSNLEGFTVNFYEKPEVLQ